MPSSCHYLWDSNNWLVIDEEFFQKEIKKALV
jgi:hypothetical protein